MKIIIAGCRDYLNFKLVREYCKFYLHDLVERGEEIEIVTGGARGVDALGKNFAIVNGYKHTEFPADWNGLGIGAGHIRNGQMAEYADGLIAFWDGKSPGTKNMIAKARKLNLRVKVVMIQIN